mmetsp:Transcript_32808/g.53575  ORF Transcript_32808/g.53575 Transcript_32808/m.53575 type:complete len:124 (+) Transcript_32808:58-429(+)
MSDEFDSIEAFLRDNGVAKKQAHTQKFAARWWLNVRCRRGPSKKETISCELLQLQRQQSSSVKPQNVMISPLIVVYVHGRGISPPISPPPRFNRCSFVHSPLLHASRRIASWASPNKERIMIP